MITLADLHAAGADVSGEHAEAWLRHPRVRAGSPELLHDIGAAGYRLGRRTLPTDLTIHLHPPTPPSMSSAPEPSTMSTPHPIIAAIDAVRGKSSYENFCTAAGVSISAIFRLKKGEPVKPATIAALQTLVDRITSGAAPAATPAEHRAPKPKPTRADAEAAGARALAGLTGPLIQVAQALGFEPATVWIVTASGDLAKARAIVLDR